MSNYRTDLLDKDAPLPSGYFWKVYDLPGGVSVEIRRTVVGFIYSTVASDVIRPPFMVSNQKVLNVATQLLERSEL